MGIDLCPEKYFNIGQGLILLILHELFDPSFPVTLFAKNPKGKKYRM
jgi:hypothetical protein